MARAPGSFDRLIPPWESVKVVQRVDGICDGILVELAQRLGPLRLQWIATHDGYKPGQAYRDTQLSGPFARWEHLHKFEPNGDGNGVLTDHIEYQLPGGKLGRLLGGGFTRHKVETMFAYRHNTTRDDLRPTQSTERRYPCTSRLPERADWSARRWCHC